MSRAPGRADEAPSWGDRIASALFLGLMRLSHVIPYRHRIPMVGWVFSRLLAPLAGWPRRIRENLALACPDLPPAEVAAIVHAVPDNAGRAMAETYSGAEFTSRITGAVLTGEGLPALRAVAEAGQPAVLACAHIGNYDAIRAAFVAEGWKVGGLYRLMNNAAFNRHYVPAIEAISQPLFARGRAGMGQMLRFLREGGLLCLAIDQYVRDGATLRFFGLPAETALTPAQLALRHDAPLIPVHAIRQPDGLSFRVHVLPPIPPGEPEAMMQAANDSLEALIREHMGQWLWVHRRWKPPHTKSG